MTPINRPRVSMAEAVAAVMTMKAHLATKIFLNELQLFKMKARKMNREIPVSNNDTCKNFLASGVQHIAGFQVNIVSLWKVKNVPCSQGVWRKTAFGFLPQLTKSFYRYARVSNTYMLKFV